MPGVGGRLPGICRGHAAPAACGSRKNSAPYAVGYGSAGGDGARRWGACSAAVWLRVVLVTARGDLDWGPAVWVGLAAAAGGGCSSKTAFYSDRGGVDHRRHTGCGMASGLA